MRVCVCVCACACVPQVYEVVPCVSDCSQYVWVAEPWSAWKVSNVDLKENCGDGVQTRKVRYGSFNAPLAKLVSQSLFFLKVQSVSF